MTTKTEYLVKNCKCKVSIGKIVSGWKLLQCIKCKLPIQSVNIIIKYREQKPKLHPNQTETLGVSGF